MSREAVDKKSGPEPQSPVDTTELEDSDRLTKRILWKLDTRVLPPLALLYLCNFFDRSNVGNAKILGLQNDLALTNHQYSIALCVFFVFYVVSELPSNLLLKRVTPKIWLPGLAIAWGVVVMCLGFVRNFAQFTAVRALLGLFEGGMYPGSLLYLSGMYTREDLALRIGLFYSMASLSGAFGGILARGLSAIPTTATVDGSWRWIMIIEGLFTILVGITAAALIPNSIESTPFLLTHEKAHARARINSSHSNLISSSAESEQFTWSEVRRGLRSAQMWLNGTAYFAICCALYSFSLFLPSIIVSLGFTNPNQAQLLTVPPYAVGAVTASAYAYLSDRLRLRGMLSLFSLPLGIIGYACIARVDSGTAKYGMTFLMATGIYASVPPILVWVLNNSAGHYKRATASAMQVCLANIGGIVAAFLYPDSEKPGYIKSHNVALGCLCYAWLAILFNVGYCWTVNRDKASGKYDKYVGYGDDRDPSFKMLL